MSDKRIFISYARQDGRALALDLRGRLESAGLSVWQDLPDMAPGRDWWIQIENILRSRSLEHLVLVLTPGSIASGNVRDEWRLARAEGKQVTQVFSADLKPDLGTLPIAMRKEHRLDPQKEEDWQKLLATVRIWDLASGAEILRLEGGMGAGSRASPSPPTGSASPRVPGTAPRGSGTSPMGRSWWHSNAKAASPR